MATFTYHDGSTIEVSQKTVDRLVSQGKGVAGVQQSTPSPTQQPVQVPIQQLPYQMMQPQMPDLQAMIAQIQQQYQQQMMQIQQQYQQQQQQANYNQYNQGILGNTAQGANVTTQGVNAGVGLYNPNKYTGGKGANIKPVGTQGAISRYLAKDMWSNK